MATKKYRCKVCGYIHEGDKAPDKCPVCQAPASEFELIEDGGKAKKGIDKNGNAYIMVYTVAIVVVVALLLSITSGALTAKLFADDIQHIYILNKQGDVIKELDPVKDFNYAPAADELPIYMAEVNSETKWIIPMNGKGLWGAIWGYIALNDDRNTVDGVFFSHASETPGLGSNIVTPAFRDQFKGKELMKDGKFVSIAVMKAGQTAQGQDQVDALSGGTITSKGVESMLYNSIAPYEPFLKKAAGLTK